MAFIVDALPAIGGGEKTLFTALELFPQADVFTLIYNRAAFTNTPIANKEISPSTWTNYHLQTHHRTSAADAFCHGDSSI
jgi:thioredoxin reductase